MGHKRDLDVLLAEMRQCVGEPVPDGLAQSIKQQIPQRLMRQPSGKDAVNIIVHFRISRVAAVAAILMALVACAVIFGGRYEDLQGLLEVLPGRGGGQAHTLSGLMTYKDKLVSEGKEVVDYGQPLPEDANAIVMHWRLDDGSYCVVFSDLRVQRLSGEMLIQLLAQRLVRKDRSR